MKSITSSTRLLASYRRSTLGCINQTIERITSTLDCINQTVVHIDAPLVYRQAHSHQCPVVTTRLRIVYIIDALGRSTVRSIGWVDPSYRPPRLHRQAHSHRRPSVSTPSFVSTSALSVTSTHCFVSTLDALHHCHCRAHSHPRSFTYHIGACLYRRHACSSHRQ